MYKIRLLRYFFKLATIGQSDKAFLLTSEFCPQKVVCPCPGAIHVEKHEKMCKKSDFKEIFLQQMVEEVRAICLHQTFDPKSLSALTSGLYTDEPKKKKLFSCFAAKHPLRELIVFAEKSKNDFFRRGFSPRNFATSR